MTAWCQSPKSQTRGASPRWTSQYATDSIRRPTREAMRRSKSSRRLTGTTMPQKPPSCRHLSQFSYRRYRGRPGPDRIHDALRVVGELSTWAGAPGPRAADSSRSTVESRPTEELAMHTSSVSVLPEINLPDAVRVALEASPRVIVPTSRAELYELAVDCGGTPGEVTY